MVVGIGVLAAPIAVLGVAGYAAVNHRKQKRIKQLQRDVLAKAVAKQNAILKKLEHTANLSEKAVRELRDRNAVLAELIRRLREKTAGE